MLSWFKRLFDSRKTLGRFCIHQHIAWLEKKYTIRSFKTKILVFIDTRNYRTRVRFKQRGTNRRNILAKFTPKRWQIWFEMIGNEIRSFLEQFYFLYIEFFSDCTREAFQSSIIRIFSRPKHDFRKWLTKF